LASKNVILLKKDKGKIMVNKGAKRVREGNGAIGARECSFLHIELVLLMAALIELTDWKG
jgi:hypothetical protein